MDVVVLRKGDRGPFVQDLQNELNLKLVPNPRLPTHGRFDGRTRRAVKQYQAANWLVQDGVVGACTWSALKDWDRYVILRRVRLVPQPTSDTCWSAATSMLMGTVMSTDPAGLNAVGGLVNDSELRDPVNMRRFANHHSLTMRYPQSYTPDAIAGLLRAHGALMINTLWDASSYTANAGSSGHMRIIAGIRGDGTSVGCTLRIYDPWPPNKGKVHSAGFGWFMRRNPTGTYLVFHR